MSGLFTASFASALISGAILAGMPLLLAALGETLGEQAGILGIGMEGYMLLGAYAGFNAAYYGHSHWLGFAAGAVSGLLAAALVSALSVWLQADQVVVGIAVILLAQGLTSVLHGVQFGSSYPRLEDMDRIAIPVLERIPVLGDSLFTQPVIFWLAVLILVAVRWFLRSTSWGLSLRAAGEAPRALDLAGVDVRMTRSWAVLASGALAGIGGAYLSILASGIFVPRMVNGLGFIAIVIAMLARGRVSLVAGGAIIFGVSLSISTALQLAGVDIPTDVVYMLPFVAVMAALLVIGRRAFLPAALGRAYRREQP